ncbi:MAG: DUF2239 family protein [Chlorobium sp.]|jgi:uncharacterized protein|nr:MAG: DUF2239 family protein [Chlorobium sp.]
MKRSHIQRCTAFNSYRCIASGELVNVAEKVKEYIDRGEALSALIFDDVTSELVEIDFRGTLQDVVKGLGEVAEIVDSTTLVPGEASIQRGPGRPKLGVVPREVTLLPRHWEWLNSQQGGASVALRKLVEEARRSNNEKEQLRKSQDVLYRFMYAIAGDLPGFEEATRSLYAGSSEKFNEIVASWPGDILHHVQKLSVNAFSHRE